MTDHAVPMMQASLQICVNDFSDRCSVAITAAYLMVEAPVPDRVQTAASPPGAAVTVRGLAPDLKARLRIRAAHNARSMEAEARAILEAALATPEADQTDLATFARSLFAPLGGVELELPVREPARDPPGFGQAAEAEPAPTRRARGPHQTAAVATPGGKGRRR
jgi:plasmid stability protein